MPSRILLLAVLILGLWSCQNEAADPETARIQELETLMETEPTAENAQQLVVAYRTFVEAYPDATDENSDYLFKSAVLEYQYNRFNKCIELLNESIGQYYDSQYTPRNAMFLATIYKEKLQNEEGANALYQTYAIAFPNDPKTQTLQDSVIGNLPPLATRIDTLKANLYDNQTNRIDFRAANDFIGVCEIYALMLPKDPAAPGYLHEAAKIAGYVNSHKKAIRLYEKIHQTYPQHEKAGQSYFMVGFIYDNELNDDTKAKEIYEEFIKAYPENDFVDDATFLMSNLGKTDDEIIESFGNQTAE